MITSDIHRRWPTRTILTGVKNDSSADLHVSAEGRSCQKMASPTAAALRSERLALSEHEKTQQRHVDLPPPEDTNTFDRRDDGEEGQRDDSSPSSSDRSSASGDDKRDNDNAAASDGKGASTTKSVSNNITCDVKPNQTQQRQTSAHAAAIIQNRRLSHQVERLTSQLVEANDEIITLRSRHNTLLRQSHNTESELRRAVTRFEMLLHEANTRIDTKDGAVRALEQAVAKSNGVIDKLRSKVEQLQRDQNWRSGEVGADRRSSAVSDISSAGGSATKMISGNASNGENGGGNLNSSFSSMMSPFRAAQQPAKPVTSSSPFALARSPERTPPRPTRTSIKTSSGNFYMSPSTSRTLSSTSIGAMNLTPVNVTPSSKSAFLLQEQKKTIESLTRTLIGERDQNAVLEKEVAELRRTLEEYRSGNMLLNVSMEGHGIQDINAAINGGVDRCNSDEFDYCGDGIVDGVNESLDNAVTGNSDDVGGRDSVFDEAFLQKLDTLGIDLSTEIANLSKVYDDGEDM